MLTKEEALHLLLRCGDVSLPAGKPVPDAAVEAVALCGRLPITLALAGAMMQEHADRWEVKLVPLLRGDHRKVLLRRSIDEKDESSDEEDEGGNNVEGRIITSSLSLLRSKRQHTAVVLFMMCAVFAEDATVAAAIFDVLEGIFGQLVEEDRARRKRLDAKGQDAKRKAEGHDEASGARLDVVDKPEKEKLLLPRRCLRVLLEHSLLQRPLHVRLAHGLLGQPHVELAPPHATAVAARASSASVPPHAPLGG